MSFSSGSIKYHWKITSFKLTGKYTFTSFVLYIGINSLFLELIATYMNLTNAKAKHGIG